MALLLSDFSTTTRVNAPAHEGESRLEFVGLPAHTTSDFCYRTSQVGVTILADFYMTEADFLAWMKARQWQPAGFDRGPEGEPSRLRQGIDIWRDKVKVTPVRQFDTGKVLVVRRGYRYFFSKPGNADNTTTIIYDLDDGRVYFRYTTY